MRGGYLMNEPFSLRELFEAHADDLLTISYSYVKDWQVAEDIVQDVFLSHWNKREAFRGESALKTYLTRIAINRSKDYLKSWRYRTHTFTNEFFSSIHPRKRLEKNEELQTVGQAVLQLPIELREIIILHFYKEYSVKEISELIGLSETSIRNRLGKAKIKLKQQLEDEKWEVLLHE
jgi:RNA polymerase sigma factor (sigma-70 family)